MSAVPVTQPASNVIHPDDLPWAQWMEGLWVKLLRVSEETGCYTILVRFADGVQLPTHRHFGSVDAYTIQGRWRYLEYDWQASAGSYVYEPPGSEHTLRAEGGEEETVVIFTIEGGLIVFGPEGEYWAYEDALTARERYFAALEAQSQPLPTGMLS